MAALIYVDIKGGLIGKQQMTSGRDAVGLAVGADTSGALACIAQAKERYPLADGVATYWNARPIRFASQFEFYLAQINPWRPRAGYFLWGNNGADFVYRDINQTPETDVDSASKNSASLPPPVRSYNFVIATQAEQQSRLWGSLPMQATHTVQCKNHAIYYFADPAILWHYLFPLGLPVPTAPIVSAASVVSGLPSTAPAEAKMGPNAVATYWPDDLSTLVGEQSSGAISTAGKGGFLVYGPYLSLPAGQYRLQVLGNLNISTQGSADESTKSTLSKLTSSKPTSIGLLDVSAQFGTKTITSMPLQTGSSQIAQLDFQLKQDTYDVEFRIQVNADVQGQVTGYRLERLGN
jgi:hypothetical protein